MTDNPAPTPDEYVALMEALMPALEVVNRVPHLTSRDLIACLQAGRLRADFDATRSPDNKELTDLALYVTMRELADLMAAPDVLHTQQSRVRAVLVAMGELSPEDA